jgi:hypothetical protein
VVQQVRIELSRVQTWLFAVPRLRAIVGANALLGETLHVTPPKLAPGDFSEPLSTQLAEPTDRKRPTAATAVDGLRA